MYDSTLVFSLAVASGILLPVLLFAFFFILYQEYPAFTESLALEKCEISLLLVGSVAGLLLNIPLFVGDNVFLGFNVGGALIPLVLSIHLLWKHRPWIVGLAVSVALVSWASYWVTDFYPSLGIAATFPQYLFPPVLAFALARVLEPKNLGRMVALAYSSGTLGALIGADLVRIPQILGASGDGMLAAIGGAGSLDMVFLSGLLAAALSIVFFPGKKWRSRQKAAVARPHLEPKRLMDDAWNAYKSGKYGLVVQLCKMAVDSQITYVAKGYGIDGPPEECLFGLRVYPHIIHDYRALFWARGTGQDALRSLTAAALLIEDLQKIDTYRYQDLGKRAVAFLIDLVVVLVVTFVLSIPIIMGLASSMSNGLDMMGMELVVALTAIMGIFWAVEITYFTIFEWRMGQTPGKTVTKMRVVCENGEKCGFMPAFTRNVLRIVDEMAVLSLVMLIPYIMLFDRSDMKQRIGDRLAGTVVVKG